MKVDRACAYCTQPIPEDIDDTFCCLEHRWRAEREQQDAFRMLTASRFVA